MNLLHLKSEEIATLKAAQALNATRLAESQVAVAALQEATAKGQSTLSEAIKGFEAERMVWEAERIALQASLAESTKATAEAGADRDFFRTQYAQASGFAGAVREENVELEQRVAIAEAQTKDGVYMIKATYVEQVKALQAEIMQANWRADLLRTQSARTDSEVRKKAGEYPGLLAQYEETLEECAMLNATIDELRRDRKALQAKLQRKAQQSLLGPADDVLRLSNGSYPSQVNDLVYRCQWRPGGDVNACLDVFDTHDVWSLSLFSSHLHADGLIVVRIWKGTCFRMNIYSCELADNLLHSFFFGCCWKCTVACFRVVMLLTSNFTYMIVFLLSNSFGWFTVQRHIL